MAIVNAVARGERGSDFSAGSDCRSAAKAGTLQDISKHNVERSAVGLPGAGNWTALFSEVCRLAEAEKLLPCEPHARMKGLPFSTHLQPAKKYSPVIARLYFSQMLFYFRTNTYFVCLNACMPA